MRRYRWFKYECTNHTYLIRYLRHYRLTKFKQTNIAGTFIVPTDYCMYIPSIVLDYTIVSKTITFGWDFSFSVFVSAFLCEACETESPPPPPEFDFFWLRLPPLLRICVLIFYVHCIYKVSWNSNQSRNWNCYIKLKTWQQNTTNNIWIYILKWNLYREEQFQGIYEI